MGTTFLIVEDEPLVRRSYERIACRRGDVLLARSVAEANAMLQGADSLSAVVVDWLLPDGNGGQILQKLRRSSRSLPAMVLTGHWEPSAVSAAYNYGAKFLMKPVDGSALDDFLSRELGAVMDARVTRPCVVETVETSFVERLAAARVQELSVRYDSDAAHTASGTIRRERRPAPRCSISQRMPGWTSASCAGTLALVKSFRRLNSKPCAPLVRPADTL